MAEKEYIEREALIEKISNLEVAGAFTETFKMVTLKIIAEHPSADVQEVVRCKDCKYSSFLSNCSKYECSLDGRVLFANDFCSSGETRIRSEQNDTTGS